MTSYPDVADLLLIADVLVTDYSSVMFDFAATEQADGLLHVPTWRTTSDVLRGFYFDLIAEAPGPVVDDARRAARRDRDADASAEKYAARARLAASGSSRTTTGTPASGSSQRIYDAGWLD